MRGIQGTSNKTFRQLMGNGLRFEIPKFQRDYTWDYEQWDDLWLDIKNLITKEESEHYLGYLVLQTSNNKEFIVIDGQQRLTTLSIIILSALKIIDNLATSGTDKESNIKRKESLLNSYIGFIDPVTLISNNKLKLNRNSDDYYRQHLVLLKDLPIRNTNFSEKHMRDCFNWFYEKLKLEFNDGIQIAKFIDETVDKLYFTVIEVTDQINAFKVFETLNARGVQLSSADLLKNYLFSVVDETKPHISELEEIESIWSKIVGKLGDQKFEDYLRYYWNSFNKSVSKKSLFKTIKLKITNKEEVFSLLRNLNDSADFYLAIQNPEDEYWKDQPETKSYLKELKLFQIKQTYSLFLSGLKNLNSKEKFKTLAKICSIISFRYNVISSLNPNIQEDVYNNVALKITKMKDFVASDFLDIYVDDATFEINFSNKEFKNTSRNHKIIKYILVKIEKYKFQNQIELENDLFSIEHILPENAKESWDEFTFDEIQRNVYRLGNFILLEKKLNKEADQKTYSLKQNIYQYSNSKLTIQFANTYDTWNTDKLASRQKEMAKDAKSIWKIQIL